jgi:hypothetical protein
MITDRVDADVIRAGADLKIIANAAVRYLQHRRRGGAEPGHRRHEHARASSDATADLPPGPDSRHHASRSERASAPGSAGRVEGWTFDFMLGSEIRGEQLGIFDHVGYRGDRAGGRRL